MGTTFESDVWLYASVEPNLLFTIWSGRLPMGSDSIDVASDSDF